MDLHRTLAALVVAWSITGVSARLSAEPQAARLPSRNGTYSVLVMDRSGAEVRKAISPNGRTLMLEAQRASFALRRDQRAVRALDRHARSKDPDAEPCTTRLATEIDLLGTQSRAALDGVRRGVHAGSTDLARNHFAFMVVAQRQVAELRARATQCLTVHYQHRGETRVMSMEAVAPRAGRRVFWDRRILRSREDLRDQRRLLITPSPARPR